MPKVITFSTTFPSYHPKAGYPTMFAQKLIISIAKPDENSLFQKFKLHLKHKPKHHTIRAGKRFKKGDYFSPRVWGNDVNPKSGRSGPYHSKQIILAEPILITDVWDIQILLSHEIYIDGKFYCSFGSENFNTLATNDGLEPNDFKNWFHKLPFDGQIICWNENVKY